MNGRPPAWLLLVPLLLAGTQCHAAGAVMGVLVPPASPKGEEAPVVGHSTLELLLPTLDVSHERLRQEQGVRAWTNCRLLRGARAELTLAFAFSNIIGTSNVETPNLAGRLTLLDEGHHRPSWSVGFWRPLWSQPGAGGNLEMNTELSKQFSKGSFVSRFSLHKRRAASSIVRWSLALTSMLTDRIRMRGRAEVSDEVGPLPSTSTTEASVSYLLFSWLRIGGIAGRHASADSVAAHARLALGSW